MFQGRGTRRYPSNQAFYFYLAGGQQFSLTIASYIAKFLDPSFWIRSRRSRSSVVACILLLPGELPPRVIRNVFCCRPWSSSKNSPLLQLICFWQAPLRVADVPAFGKQCCSLHSRFIVVSFFDSPFAFGSPSSSSSSSRSPPHHALSYAAGWLNQDGGGEGEGHFFQMQLGTAAFGGGHGW